MITNEIRPNIAEITIEEKELNTIQEATFDLKDQLSEISEGELLDELAYRSSEVQEKLPQLTEFLGNVATHESAKVAVVSFPESTIEGIPPTPTQHLEPGKLNLFTPDLYRGMVVSMANWYGYGYTTQQNQVIHNNIIPVQNLETVAGHSGSAPNELGLHVEDASYNLGENKDISPDFLTLHYYRNPTNVPTLVSMPDWQRISTQTRDLLSDSWFYNRTNPAQGGTNNNPEDSVSILYGPNSNDPWIRLNREVRHRFL